MDSIQHAPLGVDVTRADRAAAWKLAPACYSNADLVAWMRGDFDDIRTIKAFAAHRAAVPASIPNSVELLYRHMPAEPGPKPKSDRDTRAVKDWWYRAAKRSGWQSAIMLLEREGLNPNTTARGDEQAVMVCPQCEGEGYYADGLDEAACSTECTRCGTNGWIVDLAALKSGSAKP